MTRRNKGKKNITGAADPHSDAGRISACTMRIIGTHGIPMPPSPCAFIITASVTVTFALDRNVTAASFISHLSVPLPPGLQPGGDTFKNGPRCLTNSHHTTATHEWE